MARTRIPIALAATVASALSALNVTLNTSAYGFMAGAQITTAHAYAPAA